ncbi:MAG: DUF4079 domain-containing protein [Prochlorothrix sp.]|nr:DUF4079 domain-containing protein [Prochlorothrix sp.]
MSRFGETLSQALSPIADAFASFNLPEPIVHWGHPLMMGIVVGVMGTYAAVAGWQGRTATDEAVAAEKRDQHSKVALAMFIFITLGYTGGILSLVMQGQPLLESSHFWTGTLAIGLLGLNGMLSLGGFGGQASLRTAHAYLGTIALGLLLLHAVFGINLGLSI